MQEFSSFSHFSLSAGSTLCFFFFDSQGWQLWNKFSPRRSSREIKQEWLLFFRRCPVFCFNEIIQNLGKPSIIARWCVSWRENFWPGRRKSSQELCVSEWGESFARSDSAKWSVITGESFASPQPPPEKRIKWIWGVSLAHTHTGRKSSYLGHCVVSEI